MRSSSGDIRMSRVPSGHPSGAQTTFTQGDSSARVKTLAIFHHRGSQARSAWPMGSARTAYPAFSQASRYW